MGLLGKLCPARPRLRTQLEAESKQPEDGDILTIKGEKKAEHEQKNGDAYYMERRFGSFSRSLRLPFEVKDEKVNAKYDKGVLTIRVPKPAEIQNAARRIEVKAA
jgi:HSP20 family protein